MARRRSRRFRSRASEGGRLRLFLDREDIERRRLLVHVRTPNFTNMRREGGRCAFEVFFRFATLMFIGANADARPPANAVARSSGRSTRKSSYASRCCWMATSARLIFLCSLHDQTNIESAPLSTTTSDSAIRIFEETNSDQLVLWRPACGAYQGL